MLTISRRVVVWTVLLIFAGLTFGLDFVDAAEPVMTAGFAERDITPEIGMERPGGYGKSLHQSLHDPCKVRAMVLDDGTDRVALVGVDALVVPRVLVLGARRTIHEKCGVKPEAVLIAASHSHSSGPTGMILPGEYDHASAEVQALAYEKSSCADAGYLQRVEQAIVEAVCQADAARTPAQCGVGSGIEDQVAFNRRFRMKNGLTHTHPRQGNPNVVEAAGPIDPEVGVLGAWDAEGRLLGCVVNYACHATTSPGGISANYIFYLEQMIRGCLGPDVVVVFLPGACGDVTQVDNLAVHVGRAREESARFVGGRIGAEAVKVLLTIDRGTLAPLAARSKVLKIPRRVPSDERVRQCRELVQKEPKEVGTTQWTFAKEIVLLDAKLAVEPVAEAEVQAIQIGPAVFLSDPAEFFCEFGLRMKSKSPMPLTFPVSMANGIIGYVPTEEALGEHGGGYETRLTSYSNLVPEAGQQLVDTALELTRQCTPGQVPTRRKAAPFSGEGWSYGNVPPELD